MTKTFEQQYAEKQHALECLAYLEQLALQFVRRDQSQGDETDVGNNVNDIRLVLEGKSPTYGG